MIAAKIAKIPKATIVPVPVVISLVKASVIASISCTTKSPQGGPLLFFDWFAMMIPPKLREAKSPPGSSARLSDSNP